MRNMPNLPCEPDMRDSLPPRRIRFAFALLSGFALAGAAKAAEPVDYGRQVKPILKARCYACHGALKQKGHLRLDTGDLIRKGGDQGPAIEPGHADESALIDRLKESDAAQRMPPEGSPLSAEQIALVQAWIDQGAKSPTGEIPETDPLKHWSFVPPVRPALPKAAPGETSRSPIDLLLDIERQKTGLEPLGPAEPHVLLRRLYLDLTGLPPTRAELHAFLKDPSDASYRKIVDQLLASPRYGERWARHWMDVWRYSDWYGRRAVPDVLNSYGQIWRWRDWIVKALNDDRGYDSMVQSMLAADEITPDDPAEVVATGYVVRNFYRWNYGSWMKDNVEHTGKAFLGLTFNCAHCHDHKYDPIKQEDYFAFKAIFDPIDIRHDRVVGEPDPGPYPDYDYGKNYGPINSGLVRVYDRNPDVKTFLYTRGESRNVVPGKPPVAPGMPAFLGKASYQAKPVTLPPAVVYPGLNESYRAEDLARYQDAIFKADVALAKTRKETGNLTTPAAELKLKADEAARASAIADLAALQARFAADDAHRKDPGATFEAAKLTAARAEKWAAVQKSALELARLEIAADAAKAKPAEEAMKAQAKAAKAKRLYEAAQAELKADTTNYTPHSPTFPSTSTGRRKALAQWITDRTNPLAARVAVNYIWRWHFGTPLVATTHDFGRNGKPPTHPELLDWLAVELMEPSEPGVKPWSMKAIHRLIVTSDAYKMRSHPAEPNHRGFAADPANRTYWRYPAGRMESEEVRDSLLQVARVLDTTVGGPDIDFAKGSTSRRRSLYFTHHGEARMPFLEMFDAPDVCDAYKRTTSVVPQQALAMVNNDFILELSQTISDRLWSETSAETSDAAKGNDLFLTGCFESVLSRPPTPAERELGSQFLAEQANIIRGESPSSAHQADADAKARRDFVHALFSHTDFLTIH